jgi:hypothetical protein
VLRNHGKKRAETSETRLLRMAFGVTVTHKRRRKDKQEHLGKRKCVRFSQTGPKKLE